MGAFPGINESAPGSSQAKGADSFSMTTPRPRPKDATDVPYHIRTARHKTL